MVVGPAYAIGTGVRVMDTSTIHRALAQTQCIQAALPRGGTGRRKGGDRLSVHDARRSST